MVRFWVWVAACAVGALAAAMLLFILASLVTGAPAYGAGRGACDLTLDTGARPAFRLAAGDLADLSRTVWAEGRGEPLCGQVAIAYVAINRAVTNPDAWGSTVSGVVRRRHQFSVWNTPKQRARLERIDETDAGYLQAQLATSLALSGAVADPTGGATYFVSARIAPPRWARRMTALRIGGHVFYRNKD